MTTYGITGATGQLGSLAADLLLQQVDPADVVLLSRSPEKIAAAGAATRAADFDSPEGLVEAFTGIDELLLVSTDVVGSRLEGQRAAVEAAAKAGVRRVLYTSVPDPSEDNPALVAPDHLGTEQALRDSGLHWTFLRNNLYADMQADAVAQAAASGTYVTNTGTAGAAYVTRADCAAAAVGALLSTDVDDTALDVTGPQAVTADDIAALAAERRGEPVEVVQVDDAAYVAGLEQAGLPTFVAELLASFGTAIREGRLAEVTSAVEDLSGRPATPLATALA
ncbi:NAD(P)H-binding protein [Aeromicrobium sp. 50.2.37]|uniref:NAD(P)H-binding protein n=1 Tax=Aeromicrobium sp. 50.2.37 TaxID=2969305 RepID=UPI00214FB717|nr:NAD(P)H-binding protein [Aeromicrobium sp. 50.2.37]MCR4514404.1 NAD(P)H-binding protein [Aeromicrobium sp. 50.2.37]